jgi:hypothetical protein
MKDRRRSVAELISLADRIKQHLMQLDGTQNDILLWLQVQNDACRIDAEAAARRREYQEAAH